MKVNNWAIGEVELTSPSYIEFSVKPNDISDRLHDGIVQSIRGVNDFVYCNISWNITVIFRVSKIRNQGYDGNLSPNSLDTINRMIFTAEPMGTVVDSKFKPGVLRSPMVGMPIYGADEKVLSSLFSQIGDHLISLGPINNYPKVKPELNLSKILTSHIAILGNTGSGKSTTLRVLLDRINSVKKHLKRSARFIVFDVHGDYSNLGFAKHLYINKMHLPLGKLTVDDWESALLPSEKSQKPVLRRAIQIAHCNLSGQRFIYAILAKMAVADTTQESFVTLKRAVTKWYEKIYPNDEAALNKWIQHFTEIENQESLMNKLDQVLDGTSFATIDDVLMEKSFYKDDISLTDFKESFEITFGEEEVQGDRRARINTETMMSRFRNLDSRYGGPKGILNRMNGAEISLNQQDLKGSKFWIVDLTGLDDDALRLVSNYLARSVFENSLHFSNQHRNKIPFNYLYLDEAHRYVLQSQGVESSIFERIAREGRKFNVYIGIISQIPSELSKIVLSQTGAFFIHRIQNSLDLNYILANVPSATNDLVSRLPSLPHGTALLSGNAFDIPFELNVEAGEYGEASKSISPIN